MKWLRSKRVATPVVDESRDCPEQSEVYEVVCAWCFAEQGRNASESASHGICRFHAQAMIQQSVQRRRRK